MSGTCELVLVAGESGVGKSWLANHHIGSFVIEQGGVFLTGKFDQLKGSSKPFHALTSAFDQYCDVLISQKSSEWVTLIVDKLHASLGQDLYYLISMIPKLSQVVGGGGTSRNSSGEIQNCSNALQRLYLWFCQFVEVISTYSRISISLFIDDVQWADEASILCMTRILSLAPKKFFFVGCCRDDEMEEGHAFYKMLEIVRGVGVNVTTVKIGCIEEDALNSVISDLLCLSPRMVRSLSKVVHSKTKGNPLFVSQLLRSLNRDGLLRVDLSSKQWVWDKENILSTKLPDNIALCFTNGIKKLPIEVQLALNTLAMFGASAKADCLSTLETQLEMKVIDPLKTAASEGLVNNLTFAHDRIQEASYNLIGERHRRCNHLTYGRCLVKVALECGDDDMLFIAVNQCNLGASTISDGEECFTIANHNLKAGKKAMSMAEFTSAFGFFEVSTVLICEAD